MRRKLVWLLLVVLIASAMGVLRQQIQRKHHEASLEYLEEKAGLNRRVTAIDLDGDLRDAVEQLSRVTGAQIVFDDSEMYSWESYATGFPVSLHVRNARLGDALDLLCMHVNETGPLLCYSCKPDGAVHLSADKGAAVGQIYDVRDLVRRLSDSVPPSVSSKEAAVAIGWAVGEASGLKNNINVIGGRLFVAAPPPDQASICHIISRMRRLVHRNGSSQLGKEYEALVSIEPTPRPWLQMQYVQIWDVAELIDLIAHFSKVQRSPPPMAKGFPTPNFQAEAIASARELLEQVVVPDIWRENGGTGFMNSVGGRLITITNASTSLELYDFLDNLDQTIRFAGPGPAPPRCLLHTEDIFTRLRTPIPEVQFHHVPFSQAVTSLSQQCGTPMMIDPSIKLQEVSAPVSLHLWNAPLHVVLSEMVRQAPPAEKLKYWIEDGEIVIAPRGRPLDRIYDIRDIIDEAQAYHTAHGEAPQVFIARPLFTGNPFVEYSADELVEKILWPMQNSIDSDSWKDSGGWASMRFVGGLLIISQTPDNHFKIESFLDALRSGGSKEGTDMLFQGN